MATMNGRKPRQRKPATKYEMNLVDLIERYHNEDACRADLAELRWPNGVACIRCGSMEVRNSYTRNQYDCGFMRLFNAVTLGIARPSSEEE